MIFFPYSTQRPRPRRLRQPALPASGRATTPQAGELGPRVFDAGASTAQILVERALRRRHSRAGGVRLHTAQGELIHCARRVLITRSQRSLMMLRSTRGYSPESNSVQVEVSEVNLEQLPQDRLASRLREQYRVAVGAQETRTRRTRRVRCHRRDQAEASLETAEFTSTA